jgi:hypothetical protein
MKSCHCSAAYVVVQVLNMNVIMNAINEFLKVEVLEVMKRQEVTEDGIITGMDIVHFVRCESKFVHYQLGFIPRENMDYTPKLKSLVDKNIVIQLFFKLFLSSNKLSVL